MGIMQKVQFLNAWFPWPFGLFLVANVAVGQVMLGPVAVNTAIATYPNATISVSNMINGSGVTTPFTSEVTVFDEYFANSGQAFATSGSGGTNNWQSDFTFELGYQGYLDFDLGDVYQIDKLAIWNRSLSNITVKVLTDLSGPEQVVGDFTLGDYQSFPLSYPVEILPFGASYEGRYVRVEINSVYPIPGYNFGYSIVGEVVASVSQGGAPTPTLSIDNEPNGNVTITFTGTLLTSPMIDGSYTNVPGSPSSPYTLSKSNLLLMQFFRAQAD